ncbi:hypothetical protein AB0D04_39410 [Streptomyces sp. NPDC048483]|uniref:hypothetical protein n=1 Tax=Streptomyces sp. NPDC048483 TaxID=3154927 RepID=UPI00342A92F5
MTDERAEQADEASLRADAQDAARIYQAAHDLHITYRQDDSPAPGAGQLSLRHLLACFADAPLPVAVLCPEAVAAARMPELPAERVAAELRALPHAAGEIPCVRPDPAALAESARELADDQHTRLATYAAALLDHALLRSPQGAALDLLAPHVMALLWRPRGDPARSATAARRVRDAYEKGGRYAQALPFAVRIAESATGSGTADSLALGRLRTDCGDVGEAVAVLRPLLAQAERAATGRGLSLAGRTGPSFTEIFRENAAGPFTSGLSPADCHALEDVADVQHALAGALYGLRRYAECERLLLSASGLRWRVLGALHPAYMLAQLHRARALGRQRLWLEALSLVHNVLSFWDRAELDPDRPWDDALLRLALAEVMTGAVRSLREEGASRSRGVGMFPAPVVRFLDRTLGSNPRPDKVTWQEAHTRAEEAVRACDGAFGPAHPHSRAARALLERPPP